MRQIKSVQNRLDVRIAKQSTIAWLGDSEEDRAVFDDAVRATLKGEVAEHVTCIRQALAGKKLTDRVFTVPIGLLAILDRDIAVAEIPKVDAEGPGSSMFMHYAIHSVPIFRGRALHRVQPKRQSATATLLQR